MPKKSGTRKDSKGRVLRKGEGQRADTKRYYYSYTSRDGKRHVIYANTLMDLRQREQELLRNQLDGMDYYLSTQITLNQVFDRYIETKNLLRETTRTNYRYMYDRYVRDTLGKRKLSVIRYSDVKAFYMSLLTESKLAVTTLDNIHSVLHPSFDMAVRDDIIRRNPSDGIMADIKKYAGTRERSRHALTLEQQRAFLGYTKDNAAFEHWYPLFVVMFGTGCRIEEILGLRWEDLDFKGRKIHIAQAFSYHQMENGKCEKHITETKTVNSERMIPMLDTVFEAFQAEYQYQMEYGFNLEVIDGVDGFVFCGRKQQTMLPVTVNRAIKRIYEAHNHEEIVKAAREKREPLIIPHFTCHVIRHTFCTRLCENGMNIKALQEIMGHADIQTTLDIYAEVSDEKKSELMGILDKKNCVL